MKIKSKLFDKDLFENYCDNYIIMPIIVPKTERIIAIGDIHGDIKMAKKIFFKCKLINEKLEWIAEPKNTIVVQVGDQIDSCRKNPYQQCHIKYDNDNGRDMEVLKFFGKIGT